MKDSSATQAAGDFEIVTEEVPFFSPTQDVGH